GSAATTTRHTASSPVPGPCWCSSCRRTKSYPHSSQKRPARAVPHSGQEPPVSSSENHCSGPWDHGATVGRSSGVFGDVYVCRRSPQTSQKSDAVELCPEGQLGMGPSYPSRKIPPVSSGPF